VRVIVSNTGPVFHLAEVGALDLLSFAGDVHIPRGVEAELIQLRLDWNRPSWLSVENLTEPQLADAIAWRQAGMLDAGEAEALALARHLGASWFLTDDTAARLLAQALGLEVHGSLGVVLWAAANDCLDYSTAATVLTGLSESSLWISPRILLEARSALQRLMEQD
jgi:predicted nucleic acid-binding protein